MIKVLIADNLSQRVIEQLKEIPEFDIDVKPGITPGELQKDISLYEAVILMNETLLPGEILTLAENLKIIVQGGIGCENIDIDFALSKNIDKLNVPFVSTHVMTTKFYGLHPLVFRSGQLANDQTAVGNVKGILARPDLKKRTYYVIVHDYAWGHDAGERFIALAKENGIKVYNNTYDKAPIKTKDWSSYISKIKAAGVDGVYMAFITNVIPVFAKQAADFGLQAKGIKLALGCGMAENILVSCACACQRDTGCWQR